MDEILNEAIGNPGLAYAAAGATAALSYKLADKSIDKAADIVYDPVSYTEYDLEEADGLVRSVLARRQKEKWREEGIASNFNVEDENESVFDYLKP